MGIWYASREEVRESLQFGDTAVINRAVDNALEFASRKAETDLNRIFYPTLATRTFDSPTAINPSSWRLWLGADELIRLDALTVGGVLLDPADYVLGPPNTIPADRIEIVLSGGGTFGGGDTWQRSVSGTGLFGYADDSAAAGSLTAAVTTTTATTIEVADSYAVGIGSVVRAGDERMLVTRKTWLDTGQNTTGALTDELSDTAVGVADGTAFNVGEVLLIGTEKLTITDVVGNTLLVDRAALGSPLAAHLSGADVYAPRTLTVTRGVLGTTAATHLDNAALTRYEAPGGLKGLVIAEAINDVLQKASGYARVVGEGEGTRPASGAALEDIRKAAKLAFGRRAGRVLAV